MCKNEIYIYIFRQRVRSKKPFRCTVTDWRATIKWIIRLRIGISDRP